MALPSHAAVAAPSAAVAAPIEARSHKPIMLTEGQKWAPIQVASMLTISGGFAGCTKEVVPTLSIDVPGAGMMSFVELNKNKTWLMKLAKGKIGCRRGSLSRSLICDQLRTQVRALGEDADTNTDSATNAQYATDRSPPAAVAAGDERPDPMTAIIVNAAPDVATKTQKAKRIRTRGASHTVRTIDVNMHPPMTNTSQNPKLEVRAVYIPSNGAKKQSVLSTARGGGSGKLWLQVDHIPWLVAYIADECICGGVDVPDEGYDASAPAEGNCEVPGLEIKFCFLESKYTATFVTGPLIAHPTVSTLCATMDSAKWAQLVAQQKVVGQFSESTAMDRTGASEAYLKMHCQRLLDAYEDKHANDSNTDSLGGGSAREPFDSGPEQSGASGGA